MGEGEEQRVRTEPALGFIHEPHPPHFQTLGLGVKQGEEAGLERRQSAFQEIRIRGSWEHRQGRVSPSSGAVLDLSTPCSQERTHQIRPHEGTMPSFSAGIDLQRCTA